ncbi:uncharacterized protein G2W53_024631 [Senna tora]|uniref:Uncharacterized protein n=1 Tax=Senna tora TaxID=362788 RepID=A0A834TDD7_9FABA|nr:uncharacterized protein G2W53_024631 [Senna tora]
MDGVRRRVAQGGNTHGASWKSQAEADKILYHQVQPTVFDFYQQTSFQCSWILFVCSSVKAVKNLIDGAA